MQLEVNCDWKGYEDRSQTRRAAAYYAANCRQSMRKALAGISLPVKCVRLDQNQKDLIKKWVVVVFTSDICHRKIGCTVKISTSNKHHIPI